MPNQVPAIYTPGLASAAHGAATAHASSGLDFSFHDLLDIINPLQHLPVIGTLYRAITGDHIGKFEKVAGDALYGGLWGAVSSVADLAFEAVTGKDFGDTMLALVTGHHDAKAPVAQNSATPAVTASAAPSATAPDLTALTSALMQKGLNSDTAQRALAPATVAQNSVTPPDITALTAALLQKGVDSDIAQRAILAYRKSNTLSDWPLANMTPASALAAGS